MTGAWPERELGKMGALGNPLGRRTAELEAEGEQSTHQLGHEMGKMDHERIRTPRADSVCVLANPRRARGRCERRKGTVEIKASAIRSIGHAGGMD